MTNSTETARTLRAVPGRRRMVAAGLISRQVDIRITKAGVTGVIRRRAQQ
ncbi:hypothetical protein [Streptomyces adustus]|nr:hypothetical protein [Streptomyces adustus]